MIRKSILALLGMMLVTAPCVAAKNTIDCAPFEGTLRLAPDPLCQIVTDKETPTQFPDVTFLATLGVPDTCFRGTFLGTFAGDVVTGESLSGLTLNGYPPPLFTGATLVALATVTGKKLGRVFSRDSGMITGPGPTVIEEIIVRDGTKRFAGSKGTLLIQGDVMTGASVTGTLCVP